MFMQKFHQMCLIIKAKGKVFSYNHRFLHVYIVYRLFVFLYIFAQNKINEDFSSIYKESVINLFLYSVENCSNIAF